MSRITIENVLTAPAVPALPAVAVAALRLIRDPDLDLEALADAIESDEVLTARLLKIVNASTFGLARPCTTIRRSLTFLGLESVTSMVLGFALSDLVKAAGPGLDGEAFWDRALMSAAAARAIADDLHDACAGRDEPFLAALMQDLGVIALSAVIGGRYDALLAQTLGDHDGLPGLEKEVLGVSHAEVGAALARSWGIPRPLAAAIAWHHAPRERWPDLPPLVQVVILAGAVADLLVSASNEGLDELEETAAALPAARAIDPAAILQRVHHDGRALLELFRSPGPGDPEAPALPDPAPGTGFEAALAREFARCCEARQPVALLLSDVDEVSREDEALHRALIEQITMRWRVLVGFSGRIFARAPLAVVRPYHSRRDAAALAERLRRSVEATPCRLIGAAGETLTVPVSVSIGVAVAEAGTAELIPDAATLHRVAARAMQIARRDGGNRVRVFNPASIPSA